jgi:hypothetical protein
MIQFRLATSSPSLEWATAFIREDHWNQGQNLALTTREPPSGLDEAAVGNHCHEPPARRVFLESMPFLESRSGYWCVASKLVIT